MRRSHLQAGRAGTAIAARPGGPRAWTLRIALTAAIAFALAAAYGLGGLRLIDNAINDLRMRGADRPASGELVLVTIDVDSLRRLGQWPWPRGHHALVLDRLVEAGAARVAFDVSFSSPSDPGQDRLLAAAAERAGGRLLLPVFQQRHVDGGNHASLVVDRPLPQLFPDIAVASINVRPDGDGIVRSLPVTDRLGGTDVPFMATALLGADPTDPAQSYDIDFGINPYTVPRLSFADVLVGQFDPAVVAGRSVLVGATAVELGDVLAVPRWGNLAGPFVIATGFESLAQGRAIRALDAPWFVFALCFAAALAPAASRGGRPISSLLPAIAQLAGLVVLGQWLYAEWALRLDLAPVVLALLVAYGIEIGRVLRAQARRIAAQNREAERRQALLRSVVATSIDAVVIADRQGEIRLANPACERIFGLAPERLIGREATALISPHDRFCPELLAMVRAGQVVDTRFPVDVEGMCADGTVLALELALSCVAGADARDAIDDQYFIYVFRDVSAQRQLEASRRQALEAQLEAERAKADFLATASHELRTPLNHIQGFTTLLASGVGGKPTDKQREYLADIDNAATHLLGLVTDILGYAEQSGGEPHEPERSDASVRDLLRTAEAEVAALAAERHVRISLQGSGLSCRLAVDREAMARAFMHVLRNAVQFSPADQTVQVTARPGRKDHMLEVAFSDRGKGMKADEIAHVLGAFGQVESALSRHHGGLGIGLSLARASTERHGGRLAIESAPGAGTTVTFALPLGERAAADAAA